MRLLLRQGGCKSSTYKPVARLLKSLKALGRGRGASFQNTYDSGTQQKPSRLPGGVLPQPLLHHTSKTPCAVMNAEGTYGCAITSTNSTNHAEGDGAAVSRNHEALGSWCLARQKPEPAACAGVCGGVLHSSVTGRRVGLLLSGQKSHPCTWTTAATAKRSLWAA